MSAKVKAWLQTEKGRNHPAYARGCNARTKPTKPELQLLLLLNKYFPNQFKYVGDGQVIIGGRCPDFINVNGCKLVIEMLGVYWHPLFDGAIKQNHYKQYGFSCLSVWEDELDNERVVVRKVRRVLKKNEQARTRD